MIKETNPKQKINPDEQFNEEAQCAESEGDNSLLGRAICINPFLPIRDTLCDKCKYLEKKENGDSCATTREPLQHYKISCSLFEKDPYYGITSSSAHF